LKHPVYNGVGNREKFLTHTSSALEVVEEMGIKKEYDACMADVEQAKNAVEQAKSRLKDAKDFLKTVKEVDSDGRKTAEQEVIAAKTALDKAKEDRDSASAKPEVVAGKAFDVCWDASQPSRACYMV
jgi:DNA gyrase/topoisomerase IV subunit A